MPRMIKLAVAIGLICLLGAGSAAAHAMLQYAVPGVGSTVKTSPKLIRLKFSEGVEAALCRVTVTGSGSAVLTGSLRTQANDKSTLIVTMVGALKPGVYKVAWSAVSVDTHHTEGSFSFTVRP
ncbi:MAG: copper homeostasis periplasmic binding protein CopC [Rhodomicrobiaceae bacterium]